MNAKSEFAPGRSERWRHPEPRQPAWAAGSSSRGREGTKHPENRRLQGRSDFTASHEFTHVIVSIQVQFKSWFA